MATDVERLIVRLEATQRQFEKQLAAANNTANRRARQIESRFAQMNRRLGRSFAGLGRSLAAGFVAGFTVRELKQLSDAATRIENALKVAGLAGADLERVYDRLRASAMRNAAPLEALVELYSRIALVQGELGVTAERIGDLAETVALALRVSGKSAQESAGALLQLSQALGSGVVRAGEFNSMLEGAPTILQAAAAGIREAGGSVAKLRQIMLDGELSSRALFEGIAAGAPILEEKVKNAEFTIDQAMENLRTALTDAAREFNKTTGASQRFAEGIDDLARAVDRFDISGFVEKINEAYDALVGFLNRVGDAAFLKNLNVRLGITDEQGNLLNIDTSEAEKKAEALEREVKTLQERIALNTELGFDNTEALARLAEVQAALNALRASAANLPTTMPDPISGRGGADGRGYVPGTPGDPNAIAVATPGPPMVRTISVSDFPATGGSGGRGRRGGGGRVNELEREIQQIKERTEAIRAMTAAQAGINPLVEDYGYTLEKARVQQELLTAAKEAGKEITPELAASIEDLAHKYALAYSEGQKLAEAQDRIRQRAEEWAGVSKDVTGGFVKDLMNGVSAANALANALQKVADKLLDEVLDALFRVGNAGGGLGGFLGGLGGGGGGLFGGAIIPGILHQGGVAGRDGYGHGRAVSLGVFSGAQRYHDGGVVAGLRPGEVPAILQKGEVVIPKGAGLPSAPAPVYAPTYNIDASGAEAGVEQKIRAALREYDQGSFQRWLAGMSSARKRNLI